MYISYTPLSLLICLCDLVCVCLKQLCTGMQKAKTGTQVRFRASTLAGSDCIVTSLVESDGLGEAIGIPASVFLVKSLTKGLLLRSG